MKVAIWAAGNDLSQILVKESVMSMTESKQLVALILSAKGLGLTKCSADESIV